MLEKAIKILKKLEDSGYQAYIVGGFVRDYLLGRDSTDVDICTSATPKEIKQIFIDSCIPNDDYGSVILESLHHRFEITTFRREIEYSLNRKPIEIEYICDLKEDLERRDFTINTICMNSNQEIVDLLNGQADLKEKMIYTVGDPYFKFSQDPLRILRAVRFATILDFELSSEVKYAIKRSKSLLENLSYNRKKEELDKIFSSINIKRGIKLIQELELDEELQLKNLDKLLELDDFNDLIGVWSIIDVCDIYPFSNNEKDLITKVKKLYSLGRIDLKTLYKYDLYVNSIVGSMLGIDKKTVVEMYQDLPIKTRKDLCVNGEDIIHMLKIEPSHDINVILTDVENKVIDGKLENDKRSIGKYVVKNYL